MQLPLRRPVGLKGVSTMTIPPDHAVWRQKHHDVAALTEQLVTHFIDNVATCNLPPGTPIAACLAAITQTSLEIAQGILEGRDVADRLEGLAIVAAELAHEGVPIDIVLHGLRESIRIVLGQTFVQDQDWTHDTLIDGFQIAMTISDQLCMTVTHAYIGEHSGETIGQDVERTLISALLTGRWTPAEARKFGITVAETYSVLALAIRKTPDANLRTSHAESALHGLSRLQNALTERSHGQGLALLSLDGGTLLIPADAISENELDSLVEALAQEANVALVAVLVSAPTTDLASATKTAHETLEVVERLACTPGLYRFADLALEYQLSRPGPGLTQLRELLIPLDEFPELRETLRVYIANNMNRARTARVMDIHAKTVDHRLRRIDRLTELNPARVSDLWQLRSALIARHFRDDGLQY